MGPSVQALDTPTVNTCDVGALASRRVRPTSVQTLGMAAVSTDLHSLVGDDDSGAATFARYRYQAKVTLLHWLRTLVDDGPRVVYAEHVEDLVLDFGDRHVFIQVKSRDAGRHLWRASEMCDDGGGVDSLVRAYAIAKGTNCTFELHVEGGTSPSKDTKSFVEDCRQASDSLKKTIKARLRDAGLPVSHLGDFLGRLRIRPKQPDQSAVDSHCVESIVRLAPELRGREIPELAERLLQVVEAAQEARHPGLASGASPQEFLDAHLTGILQLDGDPSDVANKALTAERLMALLPSVPAAENLLLLSRAVGEPTATGSTALARKLKRAGATEAVVARAKDLRAMSEMHRIELQSGADHLADGLEDLQNRVLTHAEAVALRFLDEEAPANGIWNVLVTSKGLEDTDHLQLFHRDRQALVGLLCSVSDECRFGWQAS